MFVLFLFGFLILFCSKRWNPDHLLGSILGSPTPLHPSLTLSSSRTTPLNFSLLKGGRTFNQFTMAAKLPQFIPSAFNQFQFLKSQFTTHQSHIKPSSNNNQSMASASSPTPLLSRARAQSTSFTVKLRSHRSSLDPNHHHNYCRLIAQTAAINPNRRCCSSIHRTHQFTATIPANQKSQLQFIPNPVYSTRASPSLAH